MSDRIGCSEDMARRIAEILDRPRIAWEVLPPDAPPARPMQWYIDRARRRLAERGGLSGPARAVLAEAQAIIDAAPR